MTGPNFTTLPDEITTMILEYCFAQQSVWLVKPSQYGPCHSQLDPAPKKISACMSIVLTCRHLHRIGMPLFFKHVTLRHGSGLSGRRPSWLMLHDAYAWFPWSMVKRISVGWFYTSEILQAWDKGYMPYDALEEVTVRENHVFLSLVRNLADYDNLRRQCKARQIRFKCHVTFCDNDIFSSDKSHTTIKPMVDYLVNADGAITIQKVGEVEDDRFDLVKRNIQQVLHLRDTSSRLE